MPQVWDEAASDQGNCMGRNCPTYADCFYYRARRRVYNAQILVVNHALFFSDLALRRNNVKLLPDYDVVVFDEAHNVEGVAGSHLGMSVTSGQIDYMLSKLYNDRTNRGLAVHHKLGKAQQQVLECRHRADRFFEDVETWLAKQSGGNGRVREPEIVDNPLSEGLNALAGTLSQAATKIDNIEQRQDLVAAVNRLKGSGRGDRGLAVAAARGFGLLDRRGLAAKLATRDPFGRPGRRRPDAPRAPVRKSAHRGHDQRHARDRLGFV